MKRNLCFLKQLHSNTPLAFSKAIGYFHLAVVRHSQRNQAHTKEMAAAGFPAAAILEVLCLFAFMKCSFY